MITEFARAKINLSLHVTGRRDDGYHLLDSLVVFADCGDVVTLAPGPLSLTVTGPFAAGLSGDDNLCLRAARMAGMGAAITLDKHLPVASGIGGGSADAAAVLRGLARMGAMLPDATEHLGADVPVCMAGVPARIQGVGEIVTPLPALPDLALLLVNPGIGVSTPAIFRALTRRANPPLPDLPALRDAAELVGYLRGCRNDLQDTAIALAPVIAEVLAAIGSSGAMLARMSGSGATCFGIYPDPAQARRAADSLRPTGWWVRATGLAPRPDPR